MKLSYTILNPNDFDRNLFLYHLKFYGIKRYSIFKNKSILTQSYHY